MEKMFLEGWMAKRKFTKDQIREMRAKLQGAEQALETALTRNFMKEDVFLLLSNAKDWIEDVEWIFR